MTRFKTVMIKYMLLISAVPLALTGLFIYPQAASFIRQQIFNQISSVSQDIADKTSMFMEERITNVESWSHDIVLSSLLDSMDLQLINSYLNNKNREYLDFHSIMLFDGSGMLIASSRPDELSNKWILDSYVNENWFRKMMSSLGESVYIDQAVFSSFTSDYYSYSTLIALPIFHNERRVAILVGLVNWGFLYSIIDKTEIGHKKQSYDAFVNIIDDSGRILIAPEFQRKERRHELSRLNQYGFLNEISNPNNALHSVKYGQTKIHSSDYIYANSSIDIGRKPSSFKWSAIVFVTYSNAFHMLNILAAYIAGIVIIFIFISIYLSSKLSGKVAKPISVLSSEMRNFCSKKSPPAECLEKIDNIEMNQLMRSFQSMANDIIVYQKEDSEKMRLAAIGQSSAMVAHDIRKPFANMKSLLNMLPEKKDDPEFVKYAVGQVSDSIRKAESMLGDILDYSKETKIEKGEIGVAKLVTAAIGEVFKNAGELDIAVAYELNHCRCVGVDEVKITRSLANIIDNAVAAMGGKGCIEISTADYVAEDKTRWVSVAVSNNGPKISDEVMPHLFEPFFTKGKRGGTGLGLAICHKIVAAHGGTIDAVSDEKKTQFKMVLPAGDRLEQINHSELIRHSNDIADLMPVEPERRSVSEDIGIFLEHHKTRGGESYLLIVDDEPLFRETIRSLINRIPELRDNLKVIEADSAEVALKQFEARAFDYVISDIDMGRFNMNGYEFVDEVLNRYPNTLIMIHSNKRMRERDAALVERKNFQGFLPKPMDEEELAHFMAGKVFEQKQKSGSPLFALRSPQDHGGSKRTAVSGQRNAKKRVLIINDEDFMRIALRVQLERSADVQVLEADGVSDAMRIMEREQVDVVISDINLGEPQDGYDILRSVRAEGRALKFYMMSGMSKDDEWPKARELGADGYIQLPYRDEELKTILQ